MQEYYHMQDDLGIIPICEIKFNQKSRDTIPKLLIALQHVYCTKELKDAVFTILDAGIPKNMDRDNEGPGMTLWRILVLGVLRLGAVSDDDRLKEVVDNHAQIRQMLKFGAYDKKTTISLQSIQDNVKLLTPELLEEVNQVITGGGHTLIKKRKRRRRGTSP